MQCIKMEMEKKAGHLITEFHLILNLAVGGNWGGKYGIDEQSFPQEFVIDYVRLYSQKPDLTN